MLPGARSRYHRVELDADAEAIEALDDLRGALTAELAGAMRRGHELVVEVVDEQAEDVHFAGIEAGGELHPRNQLEAGSCRRRARGRDAVDDIVVRNGECRESHAEGLGDELVGRQDAV